MVSQKCQYALRALFELARRNALRTPQKIGDVAREQAIPARFLEGILAQLKSAGFVDSSRGRKGGYTLARAPADMTVGEIIRFVDGPPVPVACLESNGSSHCPLHGQCVFLPVWERAEKAVSRVYDGVTLEDLVREDEKKRRERRKTGVDYCI